MYHPNIPWIPQVLRCCVFLCTTTFIPGGARGVLLVSNGLSIAVCTDIVEFLRQGLNIFRLIVACGMRQHQIFIGN